MSNSKAKLSQLRHEYEEVKGQDPRSSADMARLEHQIWDTVKIIKGKGLTKQTSGERRDWFKTQYGEPSSFYDGRANILHSGPWAHKIFKLIDQNTMPIYISNSCLRKARALAKQHEISPSVALDVVISHYDGSEKSIEKAIFTPPQTTEDTDKETNGDVTSSRLFKHKILRQALMFADASMEGYEVEPVTKHQIVAEFNTGVERVITDFLTDISRTKGQAKKDGLERIGSIRFNHAREVLGLRIVFGKKFDIRRVSRAYRSRAAGLQRTVDAGHAENTEKINSARTELLEVNEAYELLRAYVKQKELGKNGK